MFSGIPQSLLFSWIPLLLGFRGIPPSCLLVLSGIPLSLLLLFSGIPLSLGFSGIPPSLLLDFSGIPLSLLLFFLVGYHYHLVLVGYHHHLIHVMLYGLWDTVVACHFCYCPLVMYIILFLDTYFMAVLLTRNMLLDTAGC